MSAPQRFSTAALEMVQWRQPQNAPAVLPCRTTNLRAALAWTSEDPTDRTAARKSCQDCPVRLVCLRKAVGSKAEGGVYGGYDFGAVAERRKAKAEVASGEQQGELL